MVAAIVVYSNTGNTWRVAEAVAMRLGATLATVRAPEVRPTPLAMFRLGFATLFGGVTPVQLQGPDHSSADLLILAAPVWAGRVAVPMRSWLATRPPLAARVALVMTGGASKASATAFADFAKHAGVTPVTTLYVSEAEAKARNFAPACDRFCNVLTAVA
jgi:hypothetical protein